MEIVKSIFHNTISLIAIIDPVAAAAILLSILPPGETKQDVAYVAKRSSLVLLIASLVTVTLGDIIFKIFGIGVSSIKVIGGLVLILLSLNMVQGNLQVGSRHSPEESDEAMEKEDISVIPLGIPILFGPGVIATLIIIKAKSTSIVDFVSVYTSIIISVGVTYIILRNSSFLMKLMGITGFKIITRIMGLIVGAIAVQFIISGIKALWIGG